MLQNKKKIRSKKRIKGNSEKNKSITSVPGFYALAKNIGIKKTKLDFGVIYSQNICNSAAVYTQNKIKGAPLYVNMEHLKDGRAQAIVVNSGIANTCTGTRGINDAKETAKLAALELGIKENHVLLASTGMIGRYLPMAKIKKGIRGMRKELSKKGKIAEAILTTDKTKKEVFIKKENFSIGAIAKGAGMLHPNMATMLAFICTDADISSKILQKMLKEAVDLSFNMLNIDMDTSTNDMCIILASGTAKKVKKELFQDALNSVCIALAKKIVLDGEGANKLFEVHVKGAAKTEDAKHIAKSVINSNLVKCAIHGNDPNWGRILCALGNSKADFDASKINVYFENIQIVKNGVSANFDYKKASDVMKQKELKIIIEINKGTSSAIAYGCDMSEEYVKINSHYST